MAAILAGVAPAVVMALLAVLLLVNMRSATDIGISVEGDQLAVVLHGWDALYCCRRRVQVPLSLVEGVGVYDRTAVPATGLRLPGTSLPRVIRAGSFGTGSARDFWDVRRGEEVLVIQLKDGADYRRLVLEVPRPREVMLELRPSLGPLNWAPARG